MPDPVSQSTEATPEDREAAEQIRSAIQQAGEVVRFVRDSLLTEARRHTPKPTALVDGECAIAGHEALSATEWMRGRVLLLCDPDGFLGEAAEGLRRERAAEPLEALAEYIRQHRSEVARQRQRAPRSYAGYITDRA